MLILADTSVWIDHLRQGEPQLEQLLISGSVATHPFIIGELACGNLKNRSQILRYLNNLSQLKEATNQEVNYLIEKQQLMGVGIGYIDAYLIASCLISQPSKLWTRDKKLASQAKVLEINFEEHH